jgi:hypothetical protein
MNRARRVIACGIVLGLLSLFPIADAQALPRTDPDRTAMVNGPVHTIVQVGNVVWLGGSFTVARGPGGVRPIAVSGLLPVNDVTGAIDRSIHIPSFTHAGGATVWDASLSPGGILYVAGLFSRVDGARRRNVAAIDPASGRLLAFAPRIGEARSVLATSSGIFVGAAHLFSFRMNGTPVPGFTPPLVSVDPDLRVHDADPFFHDIARVDPNTLVAACGCDALTDAHGSSPVKAVVEIDIRTGALRNWAPNGLGAGSGAFGISLFARTLSGNAHPWVFLAAGGSDFTAAYDAVTGAREWKTDTSGSSQAILWYEDQIVVGGHFEWTQRPSGHQCGDNAHPDTTCYHSPRLVAMDPNDGHVVVNGAGDPWNPGICCKYYGVGALAADTKGGSIHVGGAFTRMGGTWSGSGVDWTLTHYANQSNYGRLSDATS